MSDDPIPFPPQNPAVSQEVKKPVSRRGKAVKPARGEAASFAPGGAVKPKDFDAVAVAEELKLWWENGGGESFWLENAAGWSKWPSSAIEHLLTTKFVRKTKREGEFLSDQQRLLLHVREHRMVEEILPALSGYRAGIHHLLGGERVVVRQSPRLVEPKEGDWSMVKALIDAKLDLSLGNQKGPDQTVHFHGWMRTAIESLYLGGPGNFRPGQCCIFAGPKDCGKSRIQHQVITALLGGRSADPGPYLFGRTDFNSEMFGAEHLMMEDPASSTKTVDRVYFGEMLKQLVVNDTQRLHRKREDAMIVSPFFRTTISINDDPDKMRVLPLLTPDMKDKVMLFLVSPSPLPMPTSTLQERSEFRRVITEQLPAYAWWLLNTFDLPVGKNSVRFGVKEWHHPTLSAELFDDTPAAELLTIIDAAEFGEDRVKLWDLDSEADSDHKGQWWIGSALDLERLMLGNTGKSCSLSLEAKKVLVHNKIDRLLSRLKEDAPDRVAHKRGKLGRRWIIERPDV